MGWNISDGFVPFIVIAAFTKLDVEVKATNCKAWVGRGFEKRAHEDWKSTWMPEGECICEIDNILDFMVDLTASV